jgi:hypothetical protein
MSPAKDHRALVIRIAQTLRLGIGLMWLVFYSSRDGYDEGARRP